MIPPAKAQWFAAMLIALAPQAARASQVRYGDKLVAAELRRHPEATRIHLRARAKDGTPIDVAAGRADRGGPSVPLELDDAMGNAIGTIEVTLRPRRSPAAAAAVAHDISRRIFAVDNLREADPYATGAPEAPFAQRLVDRAVDAADDLVTLALHVRAPGTDTNRIVASSFGRIGKAADEDDLRVERGEVIREVTNGGRRLAVSLPLMDRRKRIVGALSTSFLVDPARGEEAAYRRAFEVRDGLARRIPSLEALFTR